MATKTSSELYVARMPFGYAHLDLDIGQVFRLANRPNDKRLLDRGYMVPFEGKEADLHECSECGERFVTEPQRRGHGDKRHPRRLRTEEEEDLRADREDRFLTQNNPLNLSA